MSRAALAAVVLLLAACGGGAAGETETHAATSASRTLVTLTKWGGFAGVHQRVVVRRSGRVVSSNGRVGGGRARVSHVGPHRLRGLRRAVRRAELPRRRTYTGSPVADAFHYRLATPGHVVTWDSPGPAPPRRVTRLAARLEALGP